MGRWKVGGPDYGFVVTAAGTRYRLGLTEASCGRFNERPSGRENALPGGWRRRGQHAVPVDRRLPPWRYHQLVRDADEMASIDPS